MRLPTRMVFKSLSLDYVGTSFHRKQKPSKMPGDIVIVVYIVQDLLFLSGHISSPLNSNIIIMQFQYYFPFICMSKADYYTSQPLCYRIYGLAFLVLIRGTFNETFPMVASFAYPIGGLYNILVYIRPKVIDRRRVHPKYSWLEAFIFVVRAGGIMPAMVISCTDSKD